ncbi:MAG: Ig-like domain-containing protein [Gemmatimonadaceae bacterium]
MRPHCVVAIAFFSAFSLACGADSTTGPKAGTPVKLRAYTTTVISGTVNTRVDPPPSVIVTDGLGNPVPGIRLKFAVGSGGGTVAPQIVLTDSNGIARADEWILGRYASTTPAGQQWPNVLWVTEPVSGSYVSFSAEAKPGPPARAVTSMWPGDTLVSGWPVTIRLKVVDSSANAIAGLVVSFTATEGGGSFAPATDTTDSTGDVSVQWILGAAGTNAAVAKIPDGPDVSLEETALDPSDFTWYDLQFNGICATNLEESMIGLGPNGQLVVRTDQTDDAFGDNLFMTVGQYKITGQSISLNTDALVEFGNFYGDRITLPRSGCLGGSADWTYLKRA